MRSEKTVIVQNKTGLHARPAAVFVQLASKFKSDVSIKKDNQEVNGKSIMGILMLAAEKGAKITIVASGEDAASAVEELASLVEKDISSELGL